MPFADKTVVPVARTQGAVVDLLRKHGAYNYTIGSIDARMGVSFVFQKRQIRYDVAVPTQDDDIIAKKLASGRGGGKFRERVDRLLRDEERRRWRCLFLAIKGRLESVADGIEDVDAAFMSRLVLENGMTIYEHHKAKGSKLLGPIVQVLDEERSE